jgi:hypothetical protein
MKELLEYRVKLIERLSAAAHEFQSACMATKDPFEKADGEWTVHQIASHTRDVDKLVYSARIRQTINEANPEFKSFDADAWMAAHYNMEESLKEILDEFLANIEELCKTLRELPREAWSRESRHETIGSGLTSQLWVERDLQHIEEHLQKAKNA